ncbi:hypothetical protein DWB68_15190 [Galactobacter valiniphilus]|uniref:Uncharacterized protein n=1 Tax=Galactobacter valiniphilus TaxID=2676122 RepID=A0A399J691_9MICC|nr:hypothetical protein DWB68_15190 [Galactobacter valiniphilus]
MRRIATEAGIVPALLERKFAYWNYDELEFHLEGAEWGHDIPVEAGYHLFSSARQVLRSAATTSRAPKAVIDAGYSRVGESLVAQCVFGQTREGSYVLPLFVPLGTLATRKNGIENRELKQDEDVFGDVKSFADGFEPAGRLTTRTMAESMALIYEAIVQTDRVPGSSKVEELVEAGVSKELVKALANVISPRQVDVFDASFIWSESLDTETPRGPARIVIPKSSADVLAKSCERFIKARSEGPEFLTGTIVEMRDEPIVSWGTATLETTRRGRPSEISFTVDEKLLPAAHAWFESHEKINVSGVVRKVRNRLHIDSPDSISSIGQAPLPFEAL